MKHKLIQLAIIFIAGVIFSWPLFQAGLPNQDDGTFMVLRATAFNQAFKDGHFPVRWLPQLNEQHGYPVTNFLYPLPFYMAEVFILAGFTPLQSIKILFGLSTILSGWAMYWWLAQKFSDKSALISSLLYMYLPYRFVDVYDRGSLGECVAFVFVPLTLGSVEAYRQTKKTTWLLWSGISLAGLIMAHNTMALIFLPVVLGYLGLNLLKLKKNNHIISRLALVILVGLSLSSFFWLPALHDLKYTRANQIEISQVNEYFQPGATMFIEQGWVALGILCLSLVFLRSRKDLLFMSVSLIALALQFSQTQNLWTSLHLDSLVQFPFRFNALITLAVPFLLAQLLDYKGMKLTLKWLLVVAVGGQMMVVLTQLPKVAIEPLTQNFFDTNFHSSTTQNEFTPIEVKNQIRPQEKPYRLVGREDAMSINIEELSTHKKYIQLVLTDKAEITFHTHYFPGWNVYVDDNPADFEVNDDGHIIVKVANASEVGAKIRDIKLVWEETQIRKIANMISFLTFFLLVWFLISKQWGNWSKGLAITLAVISSLAILWQIVVSSEKLMDPFDEELMRDKFINSQWVNPDSYTPIGDSGLYTWAGWEYVHGLNPVLINAEMPPLGKYIIGSGILLSQRPGLIGLALSLSALMSLYALSRHMLKDSILALIPVSLFSLETIFLSALVDTMLDSLQIAFLSLSFLALSLGRRNTWYFALAAMSLGAVMSTKFYLSGLIIITSVTAYYFLTRQFKLLLNFLIFLPLAGVVHALSYTQYFLAGNSFRDYLGVQKYIFLFYRQGSPDVPFGSYWFLVFLNRWHVWWGAVWGEHYVIQAKEWSLTWPLNGIVAFSAMGVYLKKIWHAWFKSTNKTTFEPIYLLVNWLLFYSAFLTLIGGWPHYMGLFLPFSSIVLVYLFRAWLPLVIKKLPFKVKI